MPWLQTCLFYIFSAIADFQTTDDDVFSVCILKEALLIADLLLIRGMWLDVLGGSLSFKMMPSQTAVESVAMK